MRSKASEKHKPEDMLLRVIRVAEILVKGQDDGQGKAPRPDPIDDKPQAGRHAQKTQTRRSGVS